MAQQRPVKVIRIGAVKACIWLNERSQNGPRHNVTISRLYKQEEEWRESTSFGRDDLLLVAKVADEAHTFIYQEGQKQQDTAA